MISFAPFRKLNFITSTSCISSNCFHIHSIFQLTLAKLQAFTRKNCLILFYFSNECNLKYRMIHKYFLFTIIYSVMTKELVRANKNCAIAMQTGRFLVYTFNWHLHRISICSTKRLVMEDVFSKPQISIGNGFYLLSR